MASSSESYHEPYDLLSGGVRDLHRALVSLEEELEAIDWYQQRADVAGDEELKAILLHNRNEEMEHAMMLLEWVRRRSPELAERAKTYLFTTAPITEVEAAAAGGPAGVGSPAPAAGDGKVGGETRPSDAGGVTTLGIGSLKGAR
jgi:uncharacterized protein